MPTPERRPAWAVPVLLIALTAVVYLIVNVLTQERGQPPFSTRVVPAPTTSPTAGAPTRPSHELTLHVTGLGPHRFGDRENTVVEELTALLGTPTQDTPEDCAAEPPARWVRWADLSIRLQSGRFVGYIEGIHYPPGPAPLAIPTTEGLAPGDRASRLFELYDAVAVTAVPMPEPSEQQATQYQIAAGSQHLMVIVEGTPESGQVAAISAGTLCPAPG